MGGVALIANHFWRRIRSCY